MAQLKNRKFLIFFSLPFAGVGFGLLFFSLIPSIWSGISMKNWIQDYAHLQTAGYHTNYGDDSTTYLAYATYTYKYRGRTYSGDRAAINTTADNIGSFHQDLGQRLARALEHGEPVQVWINPDQPEQSVLNHDIRWGLLLFESVFVIVFGGVGVGMLVFAFYKGSNTVSNDKLSHIDSQATPWLSEKQWASKTIYSNAKLGLVVAWVFCLFWNAISVPAGILVTPDVIDGDYGAAFVYLFPLVGIGLLWWSISATLRWRRFGRTPLTLDPYPGSIGGQVGGSILINLPFHNDHVFKTRVSCLYSYVSGSGKNRSRKERVVWQSEGFAESRPFNNGTRLEMLFDVEKDLPQSESKSGNTYHLWRLHVEADLPGADLNRSFEIPVFATAQNASGLRKLSTEHHRASEHRLQEIEEVLNLEQIPGGVKVFYPAFKKPVGKIIGILFGLIFLAAGLLAGSAGAPILFPILFGGTGGLIALFCFLSLITSLEVVIDRQHLKTVKRIFGISTKTRTLERSDIRALKIKKSYSESGGNTHTQYFKIQAFGDHSKPIDIGFNLAGREVALQAMESLSLLTGIPVDK